MRCICGPRPYILARNSLPEDAMVQHSISSKAAEFLKGPHLHFIGGEWVEGQGREIVVENPSDGSIITTIAAASVEQVDRAVAAARAAVEGGWGRMNARERAVVMTRFTDLIERDADIVGEILCLDMGQPLESARWLVKWISAPLFRYYAGWTDKIHGDAFDPITGMGEIDHMAVTLMEPIGVVGAIIPWNAPPGMMGLKLAPSLAAGCAVVLKTAELAPLCGGYYAKLWQEAGGPPGSLNVLHGYGEDVGAAMSAHQGIDKITFTGSTGVGKAIATAATGNLKRVTLELGGKIAVHRLSRCGRPERRPIGRRLVLRGQRPGLRVRLARVRPRRHPRRLRRGGAEGYRGHARRKRHGRRDQPRPR